MNKFYAFFALVFLTACGSSSIEGDWIGTDVALGDEMKITGNSATLREGPDFARCSIGTPNKGRYLLNCEDDGFKFKLTIYLNGDNLIVEETDEYLDDVYIFVRS